MIKRIIDLMGSLSALLLLSPVMTILAVLIRWNIGNPILFVQQRPGKNGEVFTFFKFRSMTDRRDNENNLLPDEARITRFGSWLRRTSLDELPSLFNVVKGDMSLVGPRPLLVDYLLLYSPEQARRHEVKPGITGWAQVNGRNRIFWEEKFEKDVWYVDHNTIGLDIKILFMTLFKVFIREGINSETSATMEKFNGSTQE